MRKTTLRRLDALEEEERCRREKELAPFWHAWVTLWQVVNGYNLGGLQSDEKSPLEASARALNYPSGGDFVHALLSKDRSEPSKRIFDAYYRLFAKVGLDFYDTPKDVLFDAFVTMVDQLPEQWLNWLRSYLREHCRDVKIAAGSNLPQGLSGDNLFIS